MGKAQNRVKKSFTVSSHFLEQAIENSIAQQKFEGLNPSEGIRQDLKNIACGKMTSKEVVSSIMKRIKK